MPLVSHGEGLWSTWQHHTMMGLHLGARMSVVRLAGGLLLHSPIGLRPELRAEIDALGEVTHIVCPNVFHHVYAKPWTEAYPKATVHAPAGLRAKRKDLRIDEDLDKPHPDWKGTLIPLHIGGSQLEETVFVHPASRTI